MNPPPVAPARPALLTLAQFSALYFLLAVAAIGLSRQPGNIATLWFANALGIAYLLTQPRLLAPALLLCAGGANLLANLLYGDAPALAITFLPANMLEMAIGAWLVSRSGRALAFDESPANLLRFIGLACCVPPLIGATLGAGIIATQGFAGFSRVWPAWYAGDMAGSVVTLPLALLVLRGGARAFLGQVDWPQTAALACLSCAVSVFALLYLPYPFIYVMVPLMLSAMVIDFAGVCALVALSLLTTALMMASGYFAAPPATANWQVLLVYLTILLTLVPPLLLAASMNQARLRDQVRQRFELALARSNTELQTIIDHMPAMIAYWDKDLHNQFSNRPYLDYCGRTPAQMHGRHVREVLGEERFLRNLPYIEAVLQGEAPMFERASTDPQGAQRNMLVSYVPDLEHGRVVGFYSFVTDVTSLRRARAAEAAAQTQLQGVLDSASEFSIIATDVDGVIRLFSVGAQRMLGYRADEVVGCHTPALIHLAPEVEARGAELGAQLGRPVHGFEVFAALPRLGQAESREWTYVRKDGSQLPVNLVVNAMLDDAGKVSGYLGVAKDITGPKQLQASLLAAKEQAEAASRAKSEFVANMSHEIRTPMNAVLGMAHLLGTTPLEPEQRKYLDMIRVSGQSLLAILNDILDFSKVEAGRMELASGPFVLADLLGALGTIMTVNAGDKALKLVIGVEPDVPAMLIGDALRLQQVLINLTGNAIKFTETGEVSVLVERLPGGGAADTVLLRIRVRDSGIGMDAGHRERLFAPFSQADASMTRRFGGTGLGLAICRRLVELMGGQIEVCSVLGQGSEFSVTLPLAVPAAVAAPLAPPRRAVAPSIASIAPSPEAAPAAPQDGVEAAYPSLAGVRLLLVEDNMLNQLLARTILEQAGAVVDTVDDGGTAVERLRGAVHDYDLVLMDVQMPIMDGFTATRLIRDELGLALPVLAMTAGVMVEERERCLASGMDDFIGKPLDVRQMLETIARHHRPRAAS